MNADFLPAVKEKLFRKANTFQTFLYINFVTAFLGPQRFEALPQHHRLPKAVAVFIKQFWKAAKKLHKNLPFYQRLSENLLWKRNRFPNISLLEEKYLKQ